MRTGRDFYLSWASSQVLASFLSTEKPVPRRLLCHVRGLIPSGIFLLICYNPKMHVPATGIRSLTNEPAPIQITSCQVPPPPMSFSVPRQGMQPPWIETFLPPRAYPQQAGACSLFCSFMEAGRATAYCEDQGLGFPTAMTQRVAVLQHCYPSRHHSLVSLALSVLWVQNEVQGGGQRRVEDTQSPRSAVQRSPVLKGRQACYCKWPWSPVPLWVLDPDVAVSFSPGPSLTWERHQLRGPLLPSHCSLCSLPVDRRRVCSRTKSRLSTSHLLMGRGLELIPGGYRYWLNGLRQETAASERFFK